MASLGEESCATLAAMASEFFEIESPLPAAEAFAMVIDLTRVNEWDRGVRDAKHVGGVAGEVGATFEVTVTGFDGQPTTATYELTAVDAPHSFTMVGRHPQFQADDTITFDATDAGCRVGYDASLVLLGDERPVTDEQLDSIFAALVDVPRTGLQAFLGA